MVSIYETKRRQIKGNEEFITTEFRGTSSDTKPITYIDENGDERKVANGSVFIEMDTSKIYFFDYENQEWKEF